MISENHRRTPKGTIALLGAGAAAAGLGAYLYRKPKLRKKMWKAGSVTQAATVMGQEIRQDSAEMADTVVSTMSENVADGLKKVRKGLGSRFLRGRRVAKNEARHLKSEMKDSKAAIQAAKDEAKDVARSEAQHLKNETREAAENVKDAVMK